MHANSIGNGAAERISVMLVEPENLVRIAMARVIDEIGSFHVSAQAGDVPEALSLLEEQPSDVLITEIALEGPSGIELLLELKRRKLSKIRAIVLSQVDSADMVRQALLAGAQGYILKSCSLEELRQGLQAALTNRRFLPSALAHLGDIDENTFELGGRSKPNDPLANLSPREREIFHLLANGLQNTVIAKKLFISPRTVETHRARIVRKLELTSNGELIRFAIKHGLTIV